MRSTQARLIGGLVAGASLCLALGATAPASADSASGVTFWSGSFAGQSVTYPGTTAGCAALPFVAHSEFNDTGRSINVYATADCTGQALTFPATDIHSFAGFDGRSFRVIG